MGNWIAGAIKRPGQLHRDLGVPQGKRIPAGALRAAAKQKGKVGQRARLALTLSGFHRKKTKESAVSTRDVLHAVADEMLVEALGEDASLLETWSDAARKASIAARRAKAQGKDWRKAARTSFRRNKKSVIAPGTELLSWQSHPVAGSREARMAAGLRRSRKGEEAYAKAKAAHYYNKRVNVDQNYARHIIGQDASRARRFEWGKDESRRSRRFR